MIFYFTYGTDHIPYGSGWTEVEVEDYSKAIAAYKIYHEPVGNGLLNCAAIYDEKSFKNTKMFQNGNFGTRCVERIRLSRD